MDVWGDRLDRARKAMARRGIDVLVAFSDENLQYLSGIVEPSIPVCGALVLPIDREPRMIVMWLDVEATRRQSHIKDVVGFYGQVYLKLLKVIEALKELSARELVIGIDRIPWASGDVETVKKTIKDDFPNASFVNASDMLEELRAVKTSEEIALIRKSAEIADCGMEVALEAVKDGVTEIEVAAEAEYAMRKKGSRGFKHQTVVASGRRLFLSHPFASEKKIEKGDVLVVDLGAVYLGYCSDISRTCVVGSSTKAQKDAFEAILGAQSAAFSVLRNNVKMGNVIEEVLKVLREKGCEKYFTTFATGHLVGLKFEEKPMIRPENSEVKLRSNMVVALLQSPVIAPNIGGLRLEDMSLVTEIGSEILTHCPRELIEV